jgi:hypothetical protein
MKYLPFLLLLLAAPAAHALNMASSSYTTQAITVPGSAYDISFQIQWTCDDYPRTSAPGKIELLDAGGNEIAQVLASLTMNGPEFNTTGGQDSVTDISSYGGVYTPGGEIADGQLAGVWHLTGLAPGNYTLRLWRYTTWDGTLRATTIWTTTHFLGGSDPTPPAPTNGAPAVTLDSPGEQTVTAGATLTINSHATDADGNLTGHNLDIQRPAGDWNFQGGFATGEPFQGGPVGSGGDSTRTANFTFTDVGTYYVRAAADDGSGWVHSATVAITVAPAAPTQFKLATSAGPGGSVSAGGTFPAGTMAYVTAAADAMHDFVGWSGAAGGTANPLGVTMDGDKTVVANFTLKSFTLTTSALSGGSATPGGTYPYGTTVTVAALPDALHYFTGWTGDAAGLASSIAVLLDRAKFVQAQFAPKAAQSISFTPPGDQNVGAALPLTATSSSGLPVNFVVLGGPATFNNGTLTVTGPGPITIQAVQPGDTYTLAAPPVTGTFNAAAPAALKYHTAARTLLQTGRTAEAANYVIGNP